MNKTAIKNFAVWARNKLIADITYRAGLMGIAWDGIKSALPQSTRDTEFYDIGTKEPYSITGEAVRQRRQLTELIDQKTKSSDYKTAYRSVLEEVAYTWFNRLIAIRFMEVNDYLPSRIRVLSSESRGKLEPDLVTMPFDAKLELTEAEKETVMRLKTDNQVDDLFRLLFVKQCNALNKVLPKLFEKTADYTELLLNISVTDQDGVVYHLVHDIDEDDFNIKKGGQVEIIGWLYQYYNIEPKDEVFALLKKNMKITKERIPAATQLFTPDWIVRYMVENSLGRLWLEGHPNEDLKAGWKYYLDEAEQEADVEEQLAKLREEYKTVQPEDIKVIDPCMGSGHILVYAFDVLMQIYEAAGYTQREATGSILENNLYGLDIDDRAFQLAYFAVMMKARQYNRRILNGETDCHVYSIKESNDIGGSYKLAMGDFLLSKEHQETLNYLLDAFLDAKEYGSILQLEDRDYVGLMEAWKYTAAQTAENINITLWYAVVEHEIPKLIEQAIMLTQKYDVVVTNPPYRAVADCGDKLNNYVKANYPDSKNDLSTVFMEKALDICKVQGYMAMINIPVWMSKSSFEKLRFKLLVKHSFTVMAHCGRGIFGSDFGTTAFVVQNCHIKLYRALFRQLFDELGAVDSVEQKEQWFLEGKGVFYAYPDKFLKIASYPIAYWVSDRLLTILNECKPLNDFAAPRKGLTTGDNDIFARLWFEISKTKGLHGNTPAKWYPMTKGGDFRRWYGNNSYVVNWENDGLEIRNFKDEKGKLRSRPQNISYYFREGISWNDTTATGKIAFRYQTSEFIPNASGPCVYADKNLWYLFGLLNSKVSQVLLEILAPNMKFEVGQMGLVPIILKERPEVEEVVHDTVQKAKTDWDSYETSWDFQRHPLTPSTRDLHEQMDSQFSTSRMEKYGRISWHFEKWQDECNDRFTQLKANEEQLNRIFIDIYGLQDELTPEVADKDVTVHRIFDTKDDVPESMKGSNYVCTKRDEIISLISYAVGCMFGRYSLDVDGLAYAGGEWDDGKYSSFIPDKDNILPITDEEYFPDDIVGLFCAWLKKVYGEDTLETNLDFIAGALGNKGNTSREIIRSYFLNDFIKDHIKTYQKRPIYWLFDSGKQNGFKALVYMHRYEENTIGNLRIDYLHRMESVYDNEVARMQDIIDNSEVAREVAQATKRREKLQKQLKECKEYDERIAHLALARISIDLDDGVKVNYEKVQTADGVKYPILAKI